jgi:type VI protein secretion system component Hcp
MHFALNRRPTSLGAVIIALLGGAFVLASAGPAAAKVVNDQAPALSGPFNVFLVLPAGAGLTTSRSAPTATTEQLTAFSLSTTTPSGGATPTGGSGGKVATQASATMPVDVVSTGLLRDALVSQQLNPVQVVFRRTTTGKQATFLTYTFKDVAITGYQLQTTAGTASVQINLAFQSIGLSFPAGVSSTGGGSAPPGGFDITTNKSS